jgi:sulfoxide reductase heme-binding subunit YedZ
MTQTEADRSSLHLEDVVILGVGLAAGTVIALVLVRSIMYGLTRGHGNLMDSLTYLWSWIPLWLREGISDEATLLGWPLTGETSAYWYMSRAAGLLGYLLLWAASAWGLVVSTKVAKGLIAAPLATGLHEFLSLGALVFSAFHALILLGDGYIDFNLVDVIYPFAASYRTGWVGLGQLGFYLITALIISFYVRKIIRPKTWRSLHYLTFLAYAMVVVHSLTTGTDAGELAVQAMYLGTGGTVVFLIYYRLFTVGIKRSR